jgi:serine protease
VLQSRKLSVGFDILKSKPIEVGRFPMKKFCKILLVIAGITLIFGVCGISPVNAHNVEKLKSEDSIRVGNTTVALTQMTDQVIIKYKDALMSDNLFDPASTKQMQRINNVAGVSMIYFRKMSSGPLVLRLPSKMSSVDIKPIIERLERLPDVEYAEPDIILQHTLTPNDTFYPIQWHYFDPTTGNYGINASAGWEITTGLSSIVVAVVDTGITNHVEFVGRTVPGYDFISDISVANDGDGRDSDPSDPGDWVERNECYPGSKPADSSWHGTHTAGTIGAASNNTVGVAGINWNSKILPVRVLGKCGGYTSDIIDGILWSTGLTVTGVPTNPNPAKVINLSLSGTGVCGITLQNAINSITAAGTTVVAAAGNNNADASNYYPANCNGVITVAATSRNGSKASYSNYGTTVEISAPGGDGEYTDWVVSTYNTGIQGPVEDTYAYMSGTSMAAPHVSGVASLIYSFNPSITPSQVLAILQSNATIFPDGSTCTTSTCGSGIVNAGATLANTPTTVELLSFTASGTEKSVMLNWETATEIDNLGFNLYRTEIIDGTRIQVNSEMIFSVNPGSPYGYTYEYIDSGVASGITYNYWLEDVDIYGKSTLHGPVQAKLLEVSPSSLLKIFLPAIL